MATTYEWDIETVDSESDEVLDHFHETKLSNLEGFIGNKPEQLTAHYELVLIRDHLDANYEVAERKWSYVFVGNFDDGFNVPVKYRKELSASIKRVGMERYQQMLKP